jgi:hypothetical protein
MSYTLAVKNNSSFDFQGSDGQTIAAGGGQWESGTLGNAWIESAYGGTIAFMDIGDKHIGGDSGETWGVLVTYQGEEMVGRYEGGGRLNVIINTLLQATLTGMDIRQVSLNGLAIG